MKKAFDTRVKLNKENEEICNSVGITVDQLEKKMPELREEEIKRLDSIAHKPG
jgi:molybdopterin converting factor small subunit